MAQKVNRRFARDLIDRHEPRFPPIASFQPVIRTRRREKPPFPQLPRITIEKRKERSKFLRTQAEDVTKLVRKLSPEQKRAVFLKLRHDRPLTKLDLRGTGLVLMAPPSESASLVISRNKNLEKLDKRLKEFGEDHVSDRPKGTEFATTVTAIAMADPKTDFRLNSLKLIRG